MSRTALLLTTLALLAATTALPVANALPGICWGEIRWDCEFQTDPCEVVGGDGNVKDLCGIDWFGCQYDWRRCVLGSAGQCFHVDACPLP